MVASRWAPSERSNSVPIVPAEFVYVGLASHVQPRIKAGGREEILVDGSYACHLAIKRNGGNIRWVDRTGLKASAGSLCGGGIKIIGILLGNTRLGVLNGDFRTCFTLQQAVR